MDQDPRVVKEVEDLRRRIWLIEQRLGMVGRAPVTPSEPAPTTPKEPESSADIISRLVQEEPPAPSSVSPVKSRAFSRLVHEQAGGSEERLAAPVPSSEPPRQAPVTPPITRQSIIAAAAQSTLAAARIPPRPPLATLEAVKQIRPPSPKRKSEFSLERLIGGRWYAWIGALAIVAGLGLFFKYAYDQHWLRISPALRCILGAGFGLSLLTVGEAVKRKVNAAGAAGIFAAGIGSIYASVFAAYKLYDLLPNGLALVLLATAAALGIAVGVRARLVSVTTVSLIGGYLAPFLMDTDRGNPGVLPMFLLALMGVGLTLSAMLRGPFSVLRALTWWATILIGGVWTLRTGTQHLTLSLIFLGLTWLGVHGEVLFLARRNQLIRDDGRSKVHWRTHRPLVLSFSTTAWTVLLGVNVLDAFNAPDWIAPAALFVACSMTWLALAGNIDSIRQTPKTDSERLGVCLGVQSAGLLIAAIALALGGWGEVLAWLALGVTSIVAGRWLRARAFDVYGVAVLAICVGRLLMMDSWLHGMASGGFHVYGFVLTKWAGLMASAGAAWIVMGLLMRAGSMDADQLRWRRLANGMVAAGIVIIGVSLMHSQAAVWTLSCVTVVASVALVGAGRALKSPIMTGFGFFIQLLGTVFLLPIQWWEKTTADAITGLGYYIVPAALAAPFVGLTWIVTPRIAITDYKDRKRATDFGVAAFITFAVAPLLHVEVHAASLAAALLTAGLLLMAAGRRRASAGLSTYGMAVLTGGTIAAIATRWWSVQPTWHVLGLAGGAQTLVLVYAAAAWFATAFAALLLEFRERDRLGRLCAGVAIALLMAGAYHADVQSSALCVAWLAISVAAGAARKIRPQLCLDLFMLAGLVPTSSVWIIKYAVDWQTTGAPLALHPGLLLAGLLAGAWVLCPWWSARMPGRTVETDRVVRTVGGIAALAIVFTSTSLEVARIAASLAEEPRVRAAAVSIWWGIFAVLMIAAGFWRRITPSRHVGLGLLAIAMGKAVIVDLQGVPQLWRIASFIGLGLLMLGVAVVYSKVSILWNERQQEEQASANAALPG
jgi:Predicted membrane protein (DUF2339)